MIYLDSNATTRVHPEVVEAMLPFLTEHYANPSGGYRASRMVKRAVEEARGQLAELLGADAGEIVFTGCGTESDNAALASALAVQAERRHVVTTAVEHSAVLVQCEGFEKEGVEVTRMGVDSGGRVDPDGLREAVDPGRTGVVSMIWANNETGVLCPIAECVEIAHAGGALFHTDAVQAVGKVVIDVSEVPVDYLALSGHKFHAPKGVGALYVSRRVRYRPLLVGGGQESGRRAGTENVAGVVGLGKAAEIMRKKLEGGDKVVRDLRGRFEGALLERVEGAEVNGDRGGRLGTTSNLYLPGVDAAGLILLLDEEGICCSAGSACHTGALRPSHVMTAMGFSAERARCSARFSFSMFNTEEEVDKAVETVVKAVGKIRGLRMGGGPVLSASRSGLGDGR